ncbi:helix-turn-helix domain-containing protein [Pseudomonas asplenii]|uniref:Putative conserved small protein n=1 Tax=Pseudomonas asplenii TaxID=53407 RepID=A0A0N0E3C6_9PSED|nr:XRE family transcriptional regulator [Pseudomonas fuscovaginae]KPA89896.1 putative conserved small protein [Pseudomonas fuscovaginae]KPA98163.1 putative conserved small protein [Pseudomonas fuscovaginae]
MSDHVHIERFSSVWDALEETPREAANMRLRSRLMLELIRSISAWELSQKAAAKRLGISQPRLNDLLNGKIDKFSLDALVNLSEPAQLDVDLCFGQGATQLA